MGWAFDAAAVGFVVGVFFFGRFCLKSHFRNTGSGSQRLPLSPHFSPVLKLVG